MYCALLIFCALFTLTITSGEKSSLYLDEIRSLSELPLEKLIQIKSSFSSENDMVNENENESSDLPNRKSPLTPPIALPFTKGNDKKPMRRHEEHYDEKGTDSKVSRIFQLSVTALSFLAFGGYLLTLIIMSIRNNMASNGNGNSIIIFPSAQTLQKLKRPKRNILVLDPMENNFETEKLYEGMIMLSRSYALYN